jgi:DNA-directed RNA polymerase subunit H (RpoH/RPB5)
MKTLLDRIGLDLPTANRYFKIQTTVLEMLKDRGFIIPSENEKAMKKLATFIEFIYDKKLNEDLVYLGTTLLSELITDKIITRDSDLMQEFIETYGPELVEKLDTKEVSDKIALVFKVPQKQMRVLEDSVTIGVNARKEMRAVENLSQIFKKPDGVLICTYYFFNSEDLKKETKRRINDVVIDLLNIQKRNRNLKNILFIAESKLNTIMVDDLKKYKEKMNITIFLGDNLLFNVTKHFLVPKHTLLTDDEKTALLKQTNEKNLLGRLPKIFETDPISKYFGAVPGQVFKIMRESLQDDLMTRYSEFYRVVVSEVKK